MKQIKSFIGVVAGRKLDLEVQINAWLRENSGANVDDIRFYPIEHNSVAFLIGLIIFEPSNNEEAGVDFNAYNHM